MHFIFHECSVSDMLIEETGYVESEVRKVSKIDASEPLFFANNN